MDNLITSVLTPGISVPPSDKSVTAVMTDLPPQLNSLTTGDSLLLQTLMSSEAFKLGGSLPVQLSVDGQTLALALRLEQPLPHSLEPQETHQLAVKVTARSGNTVKLQLMSVDNRQLSAPKNVSPAEPPLINRTSAPAVPLLPLKLAPVLDRLMTELKFTPAQHRQVQAALPDVQIRLAPLPPENSSPPGNAAAPQDILAPLRQALANLQTAPDLTAAMPRLAETVRSLNGLSLPAVIKDLPELAVLETPLGRVIPELPLKLPEGTPLPLEINSVSLAPVKESLPPLLQALSKVFDLLPAAENPPARQLLALLQSPDASPQFQPLVKILAPLPPREENTRLAAQILERIPAPGPQLLKNLHAFYKAASGGSAADWFGEKLTAEISSRGAEGQAVMNRAGEFVAAHTREGVSWRIIEMPFFDGSVLAKVKLAVRKNDDEEETGDSSPARRRGVRFLLETSFSRLGSFQFDGFSLVKDRRFDLVIRTSRLMPQDFVSQVMSLFKNSLHAVNYIGNININMQESFVRIAEDTTPQLADGIYI